MKLTVYELEIAQRAIKSRVLRPERILLEVEHIFGYINRLNRDLARGQEVYENRVLQKMLFPSGLASLIEPRAIRYDITKLNSTNLIAPWPDDLPDEFEDVEVKLIKEERLSMLKSNGGDFENLDDVPETKVVQKLSKRSRLSKEVKCPDWYNYEHFEADWQKVCTQLRISGERNVDLFTAISDVNLMTVIDRIVVNGDVKYSGDYKDAFVPIFLKSFNLGLDETEYNFSYKQMVSDLLSERFHEMFVK